MLHNYLSLLKRVRLLTFSSGTENAIVEMGKKWLARHFQTSEIGTLPGSEISDFGITINYPQGSTARVFTELSPDVPAGIRDALILSSCYIAPLVVFGDQSWEKLAPHAFWVKRVSRLPDEAEVMKTLQLAMEAEAQWFPMAREAFHAILDYIHGDLQPDAFDILAEKRRIQIAREAEKVFGTSNRNEQGYPFVFVADPFRLIYPWLQKMRRTLLSELPWDEFMSAGLGVAVGLVIAPENLRRFLRHEQSNRRPYASHRSHSQREHHR